MKKFLLAKTTLLAALIPAMALSASATDVVTVSRPTTPTAVKASALQSNPTSNRISARAPQSRADMAVDEGFEGFTSASWIPDGWSQESKAGEANAWKVDNLETRSIYLQSGKYGIYCPANMKAVDQWLNLPSVDVEAGTELSFRAYIDPFFSFVMGEVNEDYTYKEYVKTATLKVMVSADEGVTWSEMLDLADQYIGIPRTQLTKLANGELKDYTVDLGDYVGKTIRIAFRYVGTDGGDVGIDDVKVGPAPLAGVIYLNPFCTTYFGVSKDMKAMPFKAGIVPVFEPVTFNNYSDEYGALYSWILPEDPTTEVVEKDDWLLTLKYATDNTSDDTRRNNLKTPPTLVGESETASQAKYTSCEYIQAGGSGYFLLFGDTEPKNLGMATFDWPSCGGFKLYSPSETEDIPMFGYSESADQYWAERNGIENTDDYVHVTAIITYYACEAPIVINGAWLHAIGEAFNEDAVLKAEVVTLDEDGVMDQVLATTTLTPSQIITEPAPGTSNEFYYVLDFKFDDNVVVTPDICQAFVLRISGFREATPYFNPYMTTNGNVEGLSFSWLEKEVSIGDTQLSTMQPVAYCFDDERCVDFALMLDAYFPYLQVPEETVNVAADQTVDVPVETYWPAEAHSFTDVPEGLNVSLTGQYDEARLHISYSGGEPLDGQFNVNCPGYTRVVKVSAEASGIDDIASDDNDLPVRYFTTDGRELPAAPTAPGIYISRQGSKTAKKVVR